RFLTPMARRRSDPATPLLTGAPPPPARMLNRRLIMAACVAAALVIAVGAGLALQSPPPHEGDAVLPAKAATAAALPKGVPDLADGYGDAARIAQYMPAAAQPSAEMAARIAQIEAQAAALQKQLDHALSVITELQEAQKAVPPPPPPPPSPAPVAV